MNILIKSMEERSESIKPTLLSLVHFQEKISRCEQIVAAQKEAEAQRVFREKHGKNQKEFKR